MLSYFLDEREKMVSIPIPPWSNKDGCIIRFLFPSTDCEMESILCRVERKIKTTRILLFCHYFQFSLFNGSHCGGASSKIDCFDFSVSIYFYFFLFFFYIFQKNDEGFSDGFDEFMVRQFRLLLFYLVKKRILKNVFIGVQRDIYFTLFSLIFVGWH